MKYWSVPHEKNSRYATGTYYLPVIHSYKFVIFYNLCEYTAFSLLRLSVEDSTKILNHRNADLKNSLYKAYVPFLFCEIQ